MVMKILEGETGAFYLTSSEEKVQHLWHRSPKRLECCDKKIILGMENFRPSQATFMEWLTEILPPEHQLDEKQSFFGRQMYWYMKLFNSFHPEVPLAEEIRFNALVDNDWWDKEPKNEMEQLEYLSHGFHLHTIETIYWPAAALEPGMSTEGQSLELVTDMMKMVYVRQTLGVIGPIEKGWVFKNTKRLKSGLEITEELLLRQNSSQMTRSLFVEGDSEMAHRLKNVIDSYMGEF